MSKLRTLLGAVTLAFVPSAFAICLNPFGCEPKNLDECRSAAAKLPTNAGVSVALQDCNEKFVNKPLREEQAKKRAQVLQKFQSEQQRFQTTIDTGRASLKDVVAAMGAPPTCSTKPGKCSEVAGGPGASQTGCSAHYWNRRCPTKDEEKWGFEISDLTGTYYWFLVEVVGTDGLVLSYRIQPPATPGSR